MLRVIKFYSRFFFFFKEEITDICKILEDFFSYISEFYATEDMNEIPFKNERVKLFKTIIKICEKYPSNENMLLLKISSQNYLKTSYKSLETTKRLLKLNPYNIYALFNIAKYLNKFPT